MKHPYKFYGILIFIIYLSVVILLNTMPFSLVERVNQTYWGEFRLDYLLHSLFFLPWIFFHFIFYKLKRLRWFVVGLVLAFLNEAVQYVLSYRTFNYYDLFFNIAGLVMGYLMFTGLYFKLEEKILYKKWEKEQAEYKEFEENKE